MPRPCAMSVVRHRRPRGGTAIIPRCMRNIVILISGAGSNMEAIVRTSRADHWPQTLGAQVAGVISNRADAPGLLFAQENGLPIHVLEHTGFSSREAFDEALAQAIAVYNTGHAPALVVLAGFMRILTPGFVHMHAGRLLNIHPSLLPAFPGRNTHQRALDAGCRVVGATVHHVSEEVDQGAILAQAAVPVLPGDTAENLAQRILSQEHRIYPRAIAALLRATLPAV